MENLSSIQIYILNEMASVLFDSKDEISYGYDCNELIEECMAQGVSLFLEKNCDTNMKKFSNHVIANNLRIFYEHTELHNLLNDNHIPYVILKGCASASYYPNPILRIMGDVDFLVKKSDLKTTGELLEKIGFVPVEDYDGIHIAYHREKTTWEMHHSINGVPNGQGGDRIRHYLSDIIETSVEYTDDNGIMKIPDVFHHGLVILLHTASHITSEGVGLRHLCDWAVFVASMSNDEFISTFEIPLKECGLWKFAQILTLCSMKYLKMPEREWAGTVDDKLLERMISDIMDGGNFGKKDVDRYRQIKYISNRGEHTVDQNSTIAQVWHTIVKKAELEKKTKIHILCNYFYMVLKGKRSIDNSSTLKHARKRKQLYASFKLFIPEIRE